SPPRGCERVPPSELISAADIEKFGYCPLSWWLSRGLAPEEGPELAEGEKKHEAASADLKGIEAHEAKAREAETGVLGFAMAAAVIATAAVSFTGVVNQSLALGFVALALVWLIGASFFLYRSIGALQAARTTRDRYAVQGDLVYVDSAAEKPKLFVSK